MLILLKSSEYHVFSSPEQTADPIEKRKRKMKIESPVFKAVGSRELRQHLLPEGQCVGQLLRPPRPDAVAALGAEQRRHKSVATDQSPDGRVVAGDVQPSSVIADWIRNSLLNRVM